MLLLRCTLSVDSRCLIWICDNLFYWVISPRCPLYTPGGVRNCNLLHDGNNVSEQISIAQRSVDWLIDSGLLHRWCVPCLDRLIDWLIGQFIHWYNIRSNDWLFDCLMDFCLALYFFAGIEYTQFGRGWHRLFLKRHPTVAERLGQAKAIRKYAKSSSNRKLKEWTAENAEMYIGVLQALKEDGFLEDPSGIMNLGETSFEVDISARRAARIAQNGTEGRCHGSTLWIFLSQFKNRVLYCLVMLSHFLHSLGNYTRGAIFPGMGKINQSSVDLHRLIACLTVSQFWLDWFIGFVPPDLFLRGRGYSDST